MSGSSSIMRFSQDIASAEAPPPLPARVYNAEVIGASLRPAASSGVVYLNLQFRVPADQYSADYEGDPDGTILYYNRLQAVDNPTNRYRWRQAMTRLGGPLSMTVDVNSLIGLRANIEVVHQEYEGEMRASISKLVDA
jgi:hypothetical protein